MGSGKYVLSVLVFSCASSGISADERATTKARETEMAPDSGQLTSAFLVAALRASREELRSGTCVFDGHRLEESPLRGSVEGEVHGLIAFDAERGLLRCDRSEPAARGIADDGNAKSPPAEQQRAFHVEKLVLTSKYLRQDNFSALYRSEFGRVEKRARDNTDWMPWESPIDPRCIGLQGWLNFIRGDSFETIIEGLERYPAGEVSTEGDDVWRVRWTFAEFRYTRWLDGKKRFAPIKFEIEDHGSPRQQEWAAPVDACEATWEESNGVWVPKTLRLQHRTRVRDGARKAIVGEGNVLYALTFSWDGVNEAPVERYFDLAGLELSKGTVVGDFRGATPFVESVVGRVQRERLPEPLNPRIGVAAWWTSACLLSVALLFAVLARKYFSARARL